MYFLFLLLTMIVKKVNFYIIAHFVLYRNECVKFIPYNMITKCINRSDRSFSII